MRRRRRPHALELHLSVPADLLNLLRVLHAELPGSLDSTLLPLGFRELTGGGSSSNLVIVVPRSSARTGSRPRTSSLV
jgi:hypothetical protein